MKYDIEKNFKYHAPKKELRQPERYVELRIAGKHLAEMFLRECPESRERSLALTKIEEAVMWANAAIARNE